MSNKETCLTRAAAIVDQGEARYGHPRANFARIARLWQEILGASVTERQVGLCMIALKIAREIGNKPRPDNLVDIAGYARCIERLDEPSAEAIAWPNKYAGKE